MRKLRPRLGIYLPQVTEQARGRVLLLLLSCFSHVRLCDPIDRVGRGQKGVVAKRLVLEISREVQVSVLAPITVSH